MRVRVMEKKSFRAPFRAKRHFPQKERKRKTHINAQKRANTQTHNANNNMRLLAHNMLACNVKGVVNGYPLKIRATKVEINESEFNGQFIVHMLGKLDWGAFVNAYGEVKGENDDLPEEIPSGCNEDESFLRKVHHALLEVTVVEGHLECPESGRKFPITNTIPNMLLNEDEV